jgi:hypothetical protein
MISFIDYTTMKNNDVKIRSEYSDFPTHSFYKYKLKYFENLLKNNIFISQQYKQYNGIAKENIKKYMEEIKDLLKNI